jgi:hypothetical protein
LPEEAARCVAEEFGVDEHITRLRRILTETIRGGARTHDRRRPRIGSPWGGHGDFRDFPGDLRKSGRRFF